MSKFKPHRSVLFLPASNARAIEKARGLDCDCVILDLEDAVAPEAKAGAREAAAAALDADWGHRAVAIRANALESEWAAADYAAAVRAGAAAIVAPKVGSEAEARAAIDRAEGLPLWVMIETPRGVQHVDAIAGANGVAALVAGTNDLENELRARVGPKRAELAYALQRILIAARAADRLAVDGVFIDIEDGAGFEASCRQGQQFGFDGKTLIHPTQIEAANRIFAPGDADLDLARRIIDAHAAARAEGRGVTTLGTKMVENLHVERARRTLDIAAAIAAR